MKRFIGLLMLALAAAACNQGGGSTGANSNGVNAVVLVDEHEAERLAGSTLDADGNAVLVGVPARFTYFTSTATHELHIVENYHPGLTRKDIMRGPNPLEALSIPVLERPTLLVADEGRNALGRRVTGAYVYASRPGASEVSVVSNTRYRQLGGHPMAAPAPVTDLFAWMDVDTTSRDPLNTPVPATSRLFLSTWDGTVGSVYVATLTPDSADRDALGFTRLVALDGVPIVSVTVVPSLATRTLDGAPFCATEACVVFATRRDAGTAGDVLMLEPASGRSAKLDFGGPVKDLVASEAFARVYGILDERACGAVSCSGVLGVDLVSATTAGGFKRSLDAFGQPMTPLRTDGLITGVAVTADGLIQQTAELETTDGGAGGARGLVFQSYTELGAFSSTNGAVTFFSGVSGSVIDFDGRRTTVGSASLRVPGTLPDGGVSFSGVDGGALGTLTAATLETSPVISETWRVVTVVTSDNARWTLDLSDGYLESQGLAAIYQGQIPGLVSVATTAADGTRLATTGAEVRAAVDDLVRFETGNDTDGYVECGRTRITAVNTGSIDVAEIPAGCENRVRFTVRAAGSKPVVVAGDLEGYMGRVGPGETLTYNRPYVLLPPDVTQARTALTLSVPSDLTKVEGAFVSFEILGRIERFNVTIDAANLGCYSSGSSALVIFGPLVMAPVPYTGSNNALAYRTTVFATVPSGTSVAEIPTNLITRAGALGRTEGATCWR